MLVDERVGQDKNSGASTNCEFPAKPSCVKQRAVRISGLMALYHPIDRLSTLFLLISNEVGGQGADPAARCGESPFSSGRYRSRSAPVAWCKNSSDSIGVP